MEKNETKGDTKGDQDIPSQDQSTDKTVVFKNDVF